MVRNEGDILKKVIVSTPWTEYYNVTNLEEHNIYEVANREKAITQHDTFKNILSNFGVEVIDIEELKGHPNSVFTRDAALVTPEGYIKLRMGLPTRRGEEDWLASVLDSIGIPKVAELTPPATAEGGDIVLAGEVAFISLSPRTNEEGVKQLTETLSRMGYEVRVAELKPPLFHIGSVLSMIGPEHVIYCKGIFPKEFFKGFKKLELECGDFPAGNVLYLGKKEVIVAMDNKIAIEALYREKYTVHTVDLSEFGKGAGGPTCLVLPVERASQ